MVRAIATIQMTLSANRDYNHHCTPGDSRAPTGRHRAGQIAASLRRLDPVWQPRAGTAVIGPIAAAGRPKPRRSPSLARGCPPGLVGVAGQPLLDPLDSEAISGVAGWQRNGRRPARMKLCRVMDTAVRAGSTSWPVSGRRRL